MKHYFIGLMLAASANQESGIAVLDRDNEIILLDKLFTMQDVQYFFENFSSLKHSEVCISLPWDNSMLNGRWRIFSKLYQMVNSNDKVPNSNNWTQRFSNRGSDYFKSLSENGISLNRFELFLTRQSMKIDSCFKERSPADCKSLQSALKLKCGYSNLPTNMMPMAQLEAIVGAMLAKNNYDKKEISQTEKLFDFNGIPVLRG